MIHVSNDPVNVGFDGSKIMKKSSIWIHNLSFSYYQHNAMETCSKGRMTAAFT